MYLAWVITIDPLGKCETPTHTWLQQTPPQVSPFHIGYVFPRAQTFFTKSTFVLIQAGHHDQRLWFHFVGVCWGETLRRFEAYKS